MGTYFFWRKHGICPGTRKEFGRFYIVVWDDMIRNTVDIGRNNRGMPIGSFGGFLGDPTMEQASKKQLS